jgi:hypothetical protein
MSIACPYRTGPRNPIQKPPGWKGVTVGPCRGCGKWRLRGEQGLCLTCANREAGLPGQQVAGRGARQEPAS